MAVIKYHGFTSYKKMHSKVVKRLKGKRQNDNRDVPKPSMTDLGEINFLKQKEGV